MTTSHFSLPPSTRLQSLKGQNQELWFSRFRPMISTWVLMARWKQTHICTLKYGKSANVPLPAWSLERDVNNLFFSCICPQRATIQISYSLLEDRSGDHQYFRIDPELGFIYTQTVFDRETKSSYLLEVQSVDGWESARPGKHGQPNSGK